MTKYETIGIVVNEAKDTRLTVLRKMLASLHKVGIDAVFTIGADTSVGFSCPKDLAEQYADSVDALSVCDKLICIGGDGTLIKLAKRMIPTQTPILGINLGTLGYLTEAEISDTDLIAERIKNHKYTIEERMMLSVRRTREGECSDTDEEIALNEVVISRGDLAHIVGLKAYLNDTLLDVYPGDGLIVATPTGSTAYALSAGSAILEPEMQAIALLPICPHMIFSRQVIVGSGNTIHILAAASQNSSVPVSVDGIAAAPLKKNEALHIGKSKYITRMICFNSDKFYSMLKSKLYNRGEMLYREEIGAAGNNTGHHQS